MDSNLEKEFQFYLTNQEALIKEYQGKHLVISGEKIQGAYDSHNEAFQEAIKTLAPGTFIIQECIPGAESYSQTFYSLNVAFQGL